LVAIQGVEWIDPIACSLCGAAPAVALYLAQELGTFTENSGVEQEALAIAPEMTELRFMAGGAMVAAGDIDGGCALIAEVVQKDGRWLETLRRLAAVDLVPADVAAAIEARLAAVAQRL